MIKTKSNANPVLALHYGHRADDSSLLSVMFVCRVTIKLTVVSNAKQND